MKYKVSFIRGKNMDFFFTPLHLVEVNKRMLVTLAEVVDKEEQVLVWTLR